MVDDIDAMHLIPKYTLNRSDDEAADASPWDCRLLLDSFAFANDLSSPCSQLCYLQEATGHPNV